MEHIIRVGFGYNREAVSEHRYQYDYGQLLQFRGLDLPTAYEVHFSNDMTSGTSKTAIGNADGVLIPDEFFLSGEDVYAWLFLHDETTDGRTMYKLRIPVKKRPKPIDTEPTPVQQDVITQAIAALNDAVDRTGESAEDAKTAAEEAQASAEIAKQNADLAQDAHDETVAIGRDVAASEANVIALAEEVNAEVAEAAQSASNAAQSESNAQGYAEQASASATAADQSATDAATSESNADASARAAEGSANAASSYADASASSASLAAGSAVDASASEQVATTKAEEADASATAADASKTAAATSASNASDSATAAAQSATTAEEAAQSIIAVRDGKADAIVNSASGAIASFNDGADDVPVKDLKVSVEPVQSGTGDPSPDNVRPISGWTGMTVQRTGKNLAQFTNGKGVATNGRIHDIANRSATVTPIKIIEGKQYKWFNSQSYACIYSVFNGDTLIRRFAGIPNGTILDTTGGKELYVCGYDGSSVNVLPETCGVFFADDFDGFVPYQGNTYSITFPDEAGTVYGGTLDVTTGVLTVDRAIALLDDASLWTSSTSTTTPYAYNRDFNDRKLFNSSYTGLLCSVMPVNGTRFDYTARWAGATSPKFGIRADNPTISLDVFKDLSSRGELSISYPLATPQTYQLTPTEVRTLLKQNNIFADTGDIESVEYVADTKTYIDNKFAELQALILENA